MYQIRDINTGLSRVTKCWSNNCNKSMSTKIAGSNIRGMEVAEMTGFRFLVLNNINRDFSSAISSFHNDTSVIIMILLWLKEISKFLEIYENFIL